MKIFLTLLAPYAKKAFVVLKAFFVPKKAVFLAIPTIITFKILPNTVYAGIFLFVLMIFDFVTGILVSKKIKREAEKINPLLKNELLVTSSGVKRSGIKFLLYSSTILMAWFLQNVLMLKPIKFPFSDLHFTITLVGVCVWILVEFYSIVFENFKKLGIDVLLVFSNIKKVYKEIKKTE